MAGTFINIDQADGAASAASIATPGISHTAGNWLAAFVYWEVDSGTVRGVTNAAGDTWTQVAGALTRYPDTYGGSVDVWVVASTIGHATDVVTAAFSPNQGSRAIFVAQYSSDNGIPTTKETIASGQDTNTSITSASFSPAASGNLNISLLLSDPPDLTWTADANYVKRGVDGVHNAYQDRIGAPSGAQTASGTMSASDHIGVLVLSFVPTAAAGVQTPRGLQTALGLQTARLLQVPLGLQVPR